MSKGLKYYLIIAMVLTLILSSVLFFPVKASGTDNCEHTYSANMIVNESTCNYYGTEQEICTYCGYVLTILKNPLLEHEMTDFAITVPAGPNMNGEQESHCVLCGFSVVEEYICPHNTSHIDVLSVADCENVGVQNTICDECETILQVDEFDALGHSYSDWYITSYATPFNSGTQERVCETCEKTETEYYSMTMSSNSIYIPGTGINHKIVPCAFTQANCDAYDIIYSSSYWGVGPWIIGHNYRTLGLLSRVKVGQNIYVSVDGNIRTYKVFVSEKGTQNAAHTDITCDYSKYSIFDDFGCETLRMYTCYGGGEGRWVVFAKRV